MRTVLSLIIYFFIYSFLGWISECIYCTIGNKKVVNRGFLNGPICPIYGFGATILIFTLKNKPQGIISLLICAIVLTSILEYVTGYILEKTLHTTWWDYSNKRFNIKGRICLKNSILFGIMSVVLMKIIQPEVVSFVENISTKTLLSLAIVGIGWLMVDIIISLMALNKLNVKLDRLDEIIMDLKAFNICLDKFNEEELLSKLDKYREEDSYIQYRIEEVKDKIRNIRAKALQVNRIIKAFPDMNKKKKQKQLQYLKEFLKDKNKN